MFLLASIPSVSSYLSVSSYPPCGLIQRILIDVILSSSPPPALYHWRTGENGSKLAAGSRSVSLCFTLVVSAGFCRFHFCGSTSGIRHCGAVSQRSERRVFHSRFQQQRPMKRYFNVVCLHLHPSIHSQRSAAPSCSLTSFRVSISRRPGMLLSAINNCAFTCK